MGRRSRFSPEVHERSVRMVWEHEGEYASRWEAIRSVAGKMGCSAETLRKWLVQSEVDAGRRGGVSSAEQARVKELERENRELRRANEILRKDATYLIHEELRRRAGRNLFHPSRALAPLHAECLRPIEQLQIGEGPDHRGHALRLACYFSTRSDRLAAHAQVVRDGTLGPGGAGLVPGSVDDLGR